MLAVEPNQYQVTPLRQPSSKWLTSTDKKTPHKPRLRTHYYPIILPRGEVVSVSASVSE